MVKRAILSRYFTLVRIASQFRWNASVFCYFWFCPWFCYPHIVKWGLHLGRIALFLESFGSNSYNNVGLGSKGGLTSRNRFRVYIRCDSENLEGTLGYGARRQFFVTWNNPNHRKKSLSHCIFNNEWDCNFHDE